MGTLIVMAQASAIVGLVYLINQFVGKKHPAWHMYLVGFLFICGVFFTCRAQASNYDDYEYEYYYDYQTLTDAEKKMCTENMAKCERMARYHYNLAKDKTWWLPNPSDREKGRYCFTTAAAGILASTPQSKVIAIIGTLLTNYGLDCIAEWQFIDDNMQQSKAWWESYEFYKSALENR